MKLKKCYNPTKTDIPKAKVTFPKLESHNDISKSTIPLTVKKKGKKITETMILKNNKMIHKVYNYRKSDSPSLQSYEKLFAKSTIT